MQFVKVKHCDDPVLRKIKKDSSQICQACYYFTVVKVHLAIYSILYIHGNKHKCRNCYLLFYLWQTECLLIKRFSIIKDTKTRLLLFLQDSLNLLIQTFHPRQNDSVLCLKTRLLNPMALLASLLMRLLIISPLHVRTLCTYVHRPRLNIFEP